MNNWWTIIKYSSLTSPLNVVSDLGLNCLIMPVWILWIIAIPLFIWTNDSSSMVWQKRSQSAMIMGSSVQFATCAKPKGIHASSLHPRYTNQVQETLNHMTIIFSPGLQCGGCVLGNWTCEEKPRPTPLWVCVAIRANSYSLSSLLNNSSCLRFCSSLSSDWMSSSFSAPSFIPINLRNLEVILPSWSAANCVDFHWLSICTWNEKGNLIWDHLWENQHIFLNITVCY